MLQRAWLLAWGSCQPTCCAFVALQVGFLEADADQSGAVLPHEEIVPEGHKQGAKGVEIAQLLLGPLLAFMVSCRP